MQQRLQQHEGVMLSAIAEKEAEISRQKQRIEVCSDYRRSMIITYTLVK